jgi:hypothetical protein
VTSLKSIASRFENLRPCASGLARFSASMRRTPMAGIGSVPGDRRRRGVATRIPGLNGRSGVFGSLSGRITRRSGLIPLQVQPPLECERVMISEGTRPCQPRDYG